MKRKLKISALAGLVWVGKFLSSGLVSYILPTLFGNRLSFKVLMRADYNATSGQWPLTDR